MHKPTYRLEETRFSTFQPLEARRLLTSLPLTDLSPADDATRGAVFAIGDVQYYAFNDGVHGYELWRRDPGNPQGTLVKDINAVPTNGLGHTASSSPSGFMRLGSVVLFIADNGQNGRELWRSNGTESGTFLLRELKPGPEGLEGAALSFVRYGEGVLLLTPHEMIFTNGTTRGTQALPHADQVFFANDKAYWIDNPTTYGVRVFDGFTTSMHYVSSSPTPLTSATLSVDAGGRLIFRGMQQVESGLVPIMRVVVHLGATQAITHALDNVNYDQQVQNNIHVLGSFHGRTYFNVLGRGLFATDPTGDGAVQLTAGLMAESMFLLNGQIFFNVNTLNRNALWTTDGTQEGTEQVLQIDQQFRAQPIEFFHFNNRVAFVARTRSGWELRSWDGADAVAEQIIPLSDPAIGATICNGRLFFHDYNATTQIGTFYVTDATADGTTIAFARAVISGPAVMNVPVLNGKFVLLSQPNHADTIVTPTLVLSPNTTESVFEITSSRALGDTLYLSVRGPHASTQLWKTDGSTMIRLADLSSDEIVFQGNLGALQFFTSAGTMWRTDGTAAGTFALKSMSAARSLGTSGAIHFFVANDAAAGQAVWKTDGTVAGTSIVYSFGVGFDPALGSATVLRGKLYFLADTAIQGRQLWQSDGTARGTFPILPSVVSGSRFTSIPYTDENGTLLAVGFTPHTGSELFVLSATTEPRIMLKDRTLHIWGTNSADQLFISRKQNLADILEINVNAALIPLAFSDVNLIRVYAGAGNDKVIVDEANGVITTRTSVLGGAGSDLIKSGSGRDTLYGGDGNDSLYGGADNDYLFGEGGDDRLAGGGGRDVLWGGAGRDTWVASLLSERRDFDKDDLLL